MTTHSITKKEFERALDFKNVKKRGGKYKLKGFNIIFTQYYDDNCVKIAGKIPLTLAEAIYKYHSVEPIYFSDDLKNEKSVLEHAKTDTCADLIKTYSLDIPSARKEVDNIPIQELYITEIFTDSIGGLQVIIDTIRETNIINAWAIGND